MGPKDPLEEREQATDRVAPARQPVLVPPADLHNIVCLAPDSDGDFDSGDPLDLDDLDEVLVDGDQDNEDAIVMEEPPEEVEIALPPFFGPVRRVPPADEDDSSVTPAIVPSRVATAPVAPVRPAAPPAPKKPRRWSTIAAVGLMIGGGLICAGLCTGVALLFGDNADEVDPAADTDEVAPLAPLPVPAIELPPPPAPVEPVAEPVVAPTPELWICDRPNMPFQITTSSNGFVLTCGDTVWDCGDKPYNADGTVTLEQEDCESAD